MKKALITLTLAIAISSCGSYLDRGKNIHSDSMDFNYFDNYNEFVYKSKVNAIADKEVFYTTNFSVNLPKHIKHWESSSNEFYFEYEGKEIIYLNVGYKNKVNTGSWTVQETNNDDIYTKLNSYWNKRKYSEDALKIGQAGRVSKIYSDGKVSILLYNIKQENFEKYLTLIKSFKYLN